MMKGEMMKDYFDRETFFDHVSPQIWFPVLQI